MKCSQQKKKSQRKFKLLTAKCKYPQQTKTLTAKRKVHNKTKSPQQKRIMTLNIRTRQGFGLLWVFAFCCEQFEFSLGLLLLLWAFHFAVVDSNSLWFSINCCERFGFAVSAFGFAVSLLLLLWSIWICCVLYGNAVMFLFCCDHFIIAVTVVGHRRNQSLVISQMKSPLCVCLPALSLVQTGNAWLRETTRLMLRAILRSLGSF